MTNKKHEVTVPIFVMDKYGANCIDRTTAILYDNDIQRLIDETVYAAESGNLEELHSLVRELGLVDGKRGN